ncbi:hypothetical protein WJX73_001844 [Symbiochloris irregularis]|uniref:Uncharacterized protein n=1 Tax=Symbiochloris irregularis TaxID=706552 RepID=A0AAW1NZA6_9CHLO
MSTSSSHQASDSEEGSAGILFVLGGFWALAVLVLLIVVVRAFKGRSRSAVARQGAQPSSRPVRRPREKPKAQPELPQEVSDTSSTPAVSLKQLMKSSKKQGTKASAGSVAIAHASPLCINTLKGHGDAVLGLSFSSDGSTLGTVCSDRMLRLYTLESDLAANINYRFKKLSREPVDVAIDGASGHVLVLSLELLERAGLTMFTPGKSGLEEAWHLEDVHQGSQPLKLRSAGEKAKGIFLSASNKQDMRVVDASGKLLARVDAAGLQTYDTALSSDGKLLAAATFTADVKVHEVKRDRSGAVTEVAKVNLDLKAHTRAVTCLSFSPDSTKAATASKDGTWAVWNLAVRYHMNEDPRKLVQQPQEVPSGQCFSLMAYGPDSIIAAATSTSLQFLDASTGQALETVEDAHDGPITAMQWAPVPHSLGSQKVAVLATASKDKRVRLWRAPQR